MFSASFLGLGKRFAFADEIVGEADPLAFFAGIDAAGEHHSVMRSGPTMREMRAVAPPPT